MENEKNVARTIIGNALKISQSELLTMENRHGVVMRKAYSDINSSNPEDPKNNQIMIKMKETYDKFKRNEERETKRVEESSKKKEREKGVLNRVLNQSSGRGNKNNDLHSTTRKNRKVEKGQILDVITISSDDDQCSNSIHSSSKSAVSVLQSSLNGNPKRKSGKVKKRPYSTTNGPSNGKIAECDKSKQPVAREFIDWIEGIPDLPPDAVKTICDSLHSVDSSSQQRSTPSTSQDSYVEMFTPPLSNAGNNQFDCQTINQSNQPSQYSRRSLMEGTNNFFHQSTIQPSPQHYPHEFHSRSSLPNHLMFNSSQLMVDVNDGPSTSGVTNTPPYSSHSNGSNDSIHIRSTSFHSIDERLSHNTSTFSCLKDLLHRANSSVESDSWMEVIRPFRTDNPLLPPPPSQPNPPIPLTNPQPDKIPRSNDNVMASVNQYLPSSDYLNSSILE